MLEKDKKNVFVFYDFFDSKLAVKLEYDGITLSGEKADTINYPGVQLNVYVDTNDNFHHSKLEESRIKLQSTIENLKATDFLNIARQAHFAQNKIAAKCFLEEKARSALERISRERLKKHGRTKYAQSGLSNQNVNQTVSCINSHKGKSVFPPKDYFPFFIKDKVFSLDLFMPLLCEMLCGYDKTILVSEPIESIVSAVFVHEAKIAFIPYDAEALLFRDKHALDYKIINLERFCDTARLKQSKSELKFLRKCEQEFSECALECMARANKTETDFYDALNQEILPIQESIEKTVSEISELISEHLTQKV